MYYSSTTLYCKALLQYYSVLQSTTPVLLCTTKCYSSTTLYYKVLLQYYSVLQSTTPVTVLQRTTPVLPCTTKCSGHLPKCHEMLRLIRKVTLQLHQILRLPRKMNLPPTSPNIAPATQNESHDLSASHMKRHLQCAEQQVSPSNFTKYCACHAK